jgi:LacI family transcriptional regulator, galactose operon repressor
VDYFSFKLLTSQNDNGIFKNWEFFHKIFFLSVMKNKKTTIKDIALNCGVSISTVSRAINGDSYVKDKIKDKILRYVDDIGWRSNNLKHRVPSSEATVVVIASTSMLGFEQDATLMQMLLRQLSEKKYSPITLFSPLAEALRQCKSLCPQAIVFFRFSEYLKPYIEEFLSEGIRVVTIGEGDNYSGPINYLDHHSAICSGIDFLIKKGHRKIGFFGEFGMIEQLTSKKDIPTLRLSRMVDGFQKRLPEFDLKTDVLSDLYDNPKLLLKALKKGNHTAWICSDLKLCKQFYKCAGKLKIKIPRDLSVITFSPDVSAYDLPADVYRFCSDNTGRLEILMELLENKFVKNFRKFPTECLFIEGASVKGIYRKNRNINIS